MIILIALLGGVIVMAVGAIVRKVDRTKWSKTLVDLPLSKLQEIQSQLRLQDEALTKGFLEMSEEQRHSVMTAVRDVQARINIVEELIKKKQN